MRIHPLVPFALAVASAAVPACADSASLRANRRLQEEEIDGIEIIEAKKDGGSKPKVITSNVQLDGNMKGGKLNEVKVVGLVLRPDEQAEIFSTGLYTLVADCKDVKKNNKERIQADIRLYIKYPLTDNDLKYLAGDQLVVSQIAREVNYMPRFSLLNTTSTNNLHSIPLVSAAVRDKQSYTNSDNVGYQLYNDPGDDFDSDNDLPVFGFWGNNPGILFPQEILTPPIEVAMPFSSSDEGTEGAITGTGDFGRIQTSEGFSVEFTTANGNGVFAAQGLDSLGAAVPRDICFFSGDVTYTDMGKSGKSGKGSKSRRE